MRGIGLTLICITAFLNPATFAWADDEGQARANAPQTSAESEKEPENSAGEKPEESKKKQRTLSEAANSTLEGIRRDIDRRAGNYNRLEEPTRRRMADSATRLYRMGATLDPRTRPGRNQVFNELARGVSANPADAVIFMLPEAATDTVLSWIPEHGIWKFAGAGAGAIVADRVDFRGSLSLFGDKREEGGYLHYGLAVRRLGASLIDNPARAGALFTLATGQNWDARKTGLVANVGVENLRPKFEARAFYAARGLNAEVSAYEQPTSPSDYRRGVSASVSSQVAVGARQGELRARIDYQARFNSHEPDCRDLSASLSFSDIENLATWGVMAAHNSTTGITQVMGLVEVPIGFGSKPNDWDGAIDLGAACQKLIVEAKEAQKLDNESVFRGGLSMQEKEKLTQLRYSVAAGLEIIRSEMKGRKLTSLAGVPECLMPRDPSEIQYAADRETLWERDFERAKRQAKLKDQYALELAPRR